MAAAGLQTFYNKVEMAKKHPKLIFVGLTCFGGVNGVSGGSEIVWLLVLGQGTGVVFLENLESLPRPSKTTFEGLESCLGLLKL